MIDLEQKGRDLAEEIQRGFEERGREAIADGIRQNLNGMRDDMEAFREHAVRFLSYVAVVDDKASMCMVAPLTDVFEAWTRAVDRLLPSIGRDDEMEGEHYVIRDRGRPHRGPSGDGVGRQQRQHVRGAVRPASRGPSTHPGHRDRREGRGPHRAHVRVRVRAGHRAGRGCAHHVRHSGGAPMERTEFLAASGALVESVSKVLAETADMPSVSLVKVDSVMLADLLTAMSVYVEYTKRKRVALNALETEESA